MSDDVSKLDFRAGDFHISCCEQGHVVLTLCDQATASPATVITMSLAEAVDLSRALRAVVHEHDRWKRVGSVIPPLSSG